MKLCLSPLSLAVCFGNLLQTPHYNSIFCHKTPLHNSIFCHKTPLYNSIFCHKNPFITLSFITKHPFITLSFRSKIGREGFYEQYVFADAQSAEAYRNGHSLFSRKFWYIRES